MIDAPYTTAFPDQKSVVAYASLLAVSPDYLTQVVKAAQAKLLICLSPNGPMSLSIGDGQVENRCTQFWPFSGGGNDPIYLDGDPNNSGSLIETVPVLPLSDNKGFTTLINWDLRRKAGLPYS